VSPGMPLALASRWWSTAAQLQLFYVEIAGRELANIRYKDGSWPFRVLYANRATYAIVANPICIKPSRQR
jgi:hypothetical protein